MPIIAIIHAVALDGWPNSSRMRYGMDKHRFHGGIMKFNRIIIVFVLLSGLVSSGGAAPKIDPAILGAWGSKTTVSHEFKADGTFILEGSTTYKFEAIDGIWRYWWDVDPKSAITAEYKISDDKKSIQINMKQGKKLRKLIRIK